MRRRIKRKRGPVQSKKIVKDGITFASGLEKYTYEALLNNNLFEGYENETYQLQVESPLVVVVGNASGVVGTFNDLPLDFSANANRLDVSVIRLSNG